MGRFWLLDRHGEDGPSALVEANGSMQVVDVVRFGPDVTELADQQKIWDDVMGRVVPTLRPFVDASRLREDGVEPHADLWREGGATTSGSRGRRRNGGQRSSSVGQSGGPSRSGSRGRG